MTFYQFVCEPCSVEWDVIGSMIKPPKRRKCPECNKFCNRSYTPPGIRTRATQVKQVERFRRHGLDKIQAHEFYNSSMKHSKERIETGAQSYANMELKTDKLIKEGKLKILTPEKAEQKKEVMRKMTIESHKQAGLIAGKPKHPQAI